MSIQRFYDDIENLKILKKKLHDELFFPEKNSDFINQYELFVDFLNIDRNHKESIIANPEYDDISYNDFTNSVLINSYFYLFLNRYCVFETCRASAFTMLNYLLLYSWQNKVYIKFENYLSMFN